MYFYSTRFWYHATFLVILFIHAEIFCCFFTTTSVTIDGQRPSTNPLNAESLIHRSTREAPSFFKASLAIARFTQHAQARVLPAYRFRSNRSLAKLSPIKSPTSIGAYCSAFAAATPLSSESTTVPKSGMAKNGMLYRCSPVRIVSGWGVETKSWVHCRSRCPTFLRPTFVEWAGQTIRQSVWLTIANNVAKGAHIKPRCVPGWYTRTPYDASTSRHTLKRNRSSLLRYIIQETQ